jgi:hypothetical protein
VQGACRCPAGKALACTAESCDDGGSHHDRLSLVLDDVARPSHFVSSAQAGEEELVARVDGLVRGVHGVVPTGRLGVCTFNFWPENWLTAIGDWGLEKISKSTA